MIACRSLFRIDFARRLTYIHPASKPPQFLKICYFHQNNLSYSLAVNVGKALCSRMDKRKRKVVVHEWRPVSTQASSSETEVISAQANILEGKTFSSQSSAHEAKPVNESSHRLSSSNSPQSNNNDRDLQGMTSNAETHSISMEAGASLMRFIKGKGGATQKRIEEELNVRIIFPSSRNEDFIIIEGNTAENVAKASEKVQIIIDEAVKSPNLDYSHFVSLPLAIYPELVDKLISFQNSILRTTELDQDENKESDSNEDMSDKEVKEQILDEAPCIAVQLKAEDNSDHVKIDITNIPLVSYPPKVSEGSRSTASKLSELGIESSIFIKPKTFHLTVLMLKLWNKDRVKAAAEVLQSVSSKVMDALDGRPVFIRLKGLESMRGSLAKARVLYAPVEEVGDENRLSLACQVIINAFIEAGLVLEKDARQKLLLHATIMNARHRKRKNRTRKFDSFDARGIIKEYGSEEWGKYLIREAHLSQRFVFDENGYYRCCASIPFPENMQLD